MQGKKFFTEKVHRLFFIKFFQKKRKKSKSEIKSA